MGNGIDYGNGMVNIDTTTGIRFGVIPVHAVAEVWYGESEAHYPSGKADAAEGTAACETCEGTGLVDEEPCDDCPAHVTDDEGRSYGTHRDPPATDFEEALSHSYEKGGYQCSNDADGADIFLTKSPYYTRAAFCSPCAPGAVYLESPREDGERGYCFGHDWFDNGVAPYPVYLVATNELVMPEVR